VLFSIFPSPPDRTLRLLDRYAMFAENLGKEFG
jgi:hypothetical protein